MMRAKHQRLALLGVALAALLGAGLLAAWGLREQVSYYYMPSELLAADPEPDQAGRLGGMVEAGSLKNAPDGVTIDFTVTDGKARVPVRYTGIVPDLFVEGSGVTADGHLGADGVFKAESILARHDENYIPREMEEMTAAQRREVVAEATK